MNNDITIRFVDDRRSYNRGYSTGFWVGVLATSLTSLYFLSKGSKKQNELEQENNRLREELRRTEFERVK